MTEQTHHNSQPNLSLNHQLIEFAAPEMAHVQACELCNGSSIDKSLTMHCKGKPLSNVERGRIRRGEIDFRGTRFVDLTKGKQLAEIGDFGICDILADVNDTPWVITGKWQLAHGNTMFRFVKTNKVHEHDVVVFSTSYAEKAAETFPEIRKILEAQNESSS